MRYTKRFIVLLPVIWFFFAVNACKQVHEEAHVAHEIIKVEYPESYELANIILALTEYGQTDPMEVRQNFEYHTKVFEYFEPMSGHPLLDSVNYSREKWEDYLSFRTDSYAFEFDDTGRLYRKFDFYTNEGFQLFDKHLDLVNDFVEKSNFRVFFQQNKDYYTKISDRYKKTQYLNEMREFLISEFGEQYANDAQYKIVLSPFVYRMNCHREIDSMVAADFITIPDYVLSDTISINKKNVATSLHNLFTEMDHGYINPTTQMYSELVNKNFDASLWDNDSGYNEEDGYDHTGNAVFNEYMTWAVYDLFLERFFPDYAQEIGLYWSFQNDSRGFLYSHLFTQKLLGLYHEREEGETLKDLYPKLLEWTASIQPELSKPLIDSTQTKASKAFPAKTRITVHFSEPMKQADTITTMFQDGRNTKLFIDLTKTEHHLNWAEDGMSMEYEIELPKEWEGHYFQFNWWDTPHPLISAKGVLVKYGTFFQVN